MRSLLLNGVLLGCLAFSTATAQPPARVMLDDFTTITTWQNMGGTENPEENIYWSRCGSFPRKSMKSTLWRTGLLTGRLSGC